MKHRTVLFASLSLALAAISLADVATVRVQVGGKTYSGQLAAEPEGTTPATLPAVTQPAPPAVELPKDAEPLGGIAPFQVHLDAADVIKPLAIRDVRVAWDFGDAQGKYNTLDGFNAAHVYDSPGKFVITRTLTSGTTNATKQWIVTVTPSTRRTTYVSLDGDDHNDGKTPATAVRTFGRGILGANGGNGEVLFRRGDQFNITKAFKLGYEDVRLGAFGDADKPKPLIFNLGPLDSTMMLEATGKRTLIEDITFDAPKAKLFDKAGTLDVVVARGAGLVVRRCTILNVNDLVNGNGIPNGVLIQDCDSPLETGLRSYLAWMQGSDWTVLGNRVVNSTREHIIRVGGAERLNIQFNTLTNMDRTKATTQPDQYDVAKGVLNVQKGSVLYAANNVLHGPSGVGPLGKADGLNDKVARWNGAIVEHNRITGMFEAKHGATHLTYRDNFFIASDQPAFNIDGYAKDYDRRVDDLRIENNTVINYGKNGSFLSLLAGAHNVALVKNVYIAPQLAIGAAEAAGVRVFDSDLRAFSTISDNIWPVAKPVGFAHNGVHYVYEKVGDASGFIEPAAWMKMPNVSGDRFEKIAAADWASVTDAGVDASRLPETPATTEPAR